MDLHEMSKPCEQGIKAEAWTSIFPWLGRVGDGRKSMSINLSGTVSVRTARLIQNNQKKRIPLCSFNILFLKNKSDHSWNSDKNGSSRQVS